jgi:hypothetical protein
MVYLEINKKNYNTRTPNLLEQLNKYLSNKNNKSFVLIYMEGCGPCNETRPEWSKLKNILSKSNNNKTIGVFSIDKDLVSKVSKLKEPNSFPTIRYITDSGNKVENYEDSDISKKDRSIDSFIEWIKDKSGEKNITKSETQSIKKTKTKTNRRQNGGTIKMRGGKWSLKYKRSINCNRPKGFSQRQHCKYGRKHKKIL